MGRFDGAVALVTGASRGIGFSVDEHRAAVYALIEREFGRIDHFVSNAGVNPSYGPMLDIEPAAMRKIIEINVISALTWSKDAVAAGRHHDRLCESAL